jgi:hypothetical protein
MSTNERRNDGGRRLKMDRRKGANSMISTLSGYDGPERRVTTDRRGLSERRN